jgi:hypothetical protein
MQEFAATMWVLVIGVALNTVLGIAATVAAVIGEIRVWVHPRLQSTFHGDLRWTARHSHRYPGFNYAIYVVGTALVFRLVTSGAILPAVLTVGLHREEAESSVGSLLGRIAIFVLPLAVIPGYAWLSARVIARHSVECWPPDTVENIEFTCGGNVFIGQSQRRILTQCFSPRSRHFATCIGLAALYCYFIRALAVCIFLSVPLNELSRSCCRLWESYC